MFSSSHLPIASLPHSMDQTLCSGATTGVRAQEQPPARTHQVRDSRPGSPCACCFPEAVEHVVAQVHYDSAKAWFYERQKSSQRFRCEDFVFVQ
jgi:hypothetical protein